MEMGKGSSLGRKKEVNTEEHGRKVKGEWSDIVDLIGKSNKIRLLMEEGGRRI